MSIKLLTRRNNTAVSIRENRVKACIKGPKYQFFFCKIQVFQIRIICKHLSKFLLYLVSFKNISIPPNYYSESVSYLKY